MRAASSVHWRMIRHGLCLMIPSWPVSVPSTVKVCCERLRSNCIVKNCTKEKPKLASRKPELRVRRSKPRLKRARYVSRAWQS